jgi:hypothetical protein
MRGKPITVHTPWSNLQGARLQTLRAQLRSTVHLDEDVALLVLSSRRLEELQMRPRAP